VPQNSKNDFYHFQLSWFFQVYDVFDFMVKLVVLAHLNLPSALCKLLKLRLVHGFLRRQVRRDRPALYWTNVFLQETRMRHFVYEFVLPRSTDVKGSELIGVRSWFNSLFFLLNPFYFANQIVNFAVLAAAERLSHAQVGQSMLVIFQNH